MPKGPQGQKRKADVIGNAVLVMQIATGETKDSKRDTTVEANRKGGLKGGKARAKALTSEQRKKIAQKAAKARWG
ncbi:RNA-binding protein [Rhizomicrobium sp. SCGC AG-212-E05]|nr:RNA-binding protein [Rhizomicrobium sp. SCGC AG-212-E05]